MALCQCGKKAHPLYNGKCEDCWVDGKNTCGNMLSADCPPTSYRPTLNEVNSTQVKEGSAQRQKIGHARYRIAAKHEHKAG